MSFGSQKLVHTDGTMHHLGIDAVTPRVILVPDPQEVPLYAALLEGPVQQGCYREYATWRGIWRGEPLTVMSCGFGCMPMAIAVEELHHLGAEDRSLPRHPAGAGAGHAAGSLRRGPR